MGGSEALLTGRIDRRVMTWLVVSVLAVLPLEALAYDQTVVWASVPIRAGILVLVLVGLRLRRLDPITAGRVFLAVGLSSMIVFGVFLDAPADRAELEAVAYGTILSIFALLVAPKRWRRWWSIGVAVLVLIPAAVRLVPDHVELFVQTIIILAVHSIAVAAVDVHANRVEQVGEMASIDPLTGLPNRRPMLDRLADRQRAALESAAPATIITLDLDHFKQLNDSLGHEAGDDALRRVGRALISSVDPKDSVCRWGGEEFLVLLPDTAEVEGLVVAERLRLAIEVTGVTASFGLAAVIADDSVSNWVRRADMAMYQAKGNGRNQVVVSTTGLLSKSSTR